MGMSVPGGAGRRIRGWGLPIAVLCWLAVMAPQSLAAAEPELTVVGNRADLVSGGDALVEVKWPGGVDPASARFFLNGKELSGTFAPRPNGRYMGTVTGLRLGDNDLAVTVPGGGAKLQITNHPASGP